jgi:hypothetical protein
MPGTAFVGPGIHKPASTTGGGLRAAVDRSRFGGAKRECRGAPGEDIDDVESRVRAAADDLARVGRTLRHPRSEDEIWQLLDAAPSAELALGGEPPAGLLRSIGS